MHSHRSIDGSRDTGTGLYYLPPEHPQVVERDNLHPHAPNSGSTADVLLLEGTVTDLQSNPLVGARVEVWHALQSTNPDIDGYALEKHGVGNLPGRGIVKTDAHGVFKLLTSLPPVTEEDIAGTLLEIRPHIHFRVTPAAGTPTLATIVFIDPEPHKLASDPIYRRYGGELGDAVPFKIGSPPPTGYSGDHYECAVELAVGRKHQLCVGMEVDPVEVVHELPCSVDTFWKTYWDRDAFDFLAARMRHHFSATTKTCLFDLVEVGARWPDAPPAWDSSWTLDVRGPSNGTLGAAFPLLPSMVWPLRYREDRVWRAGAGQPRVDYVMRPLPGHDSPVVDSSLSGTVRVEAHATKPDTCIRRITLGGRVALTPAAIAGGLRLPEVVKFFQQGLERDGDASAVVLRAWFAGDRDPCGLPKSTATALWDHTAGPPAYLQHLRTIGDLDHDNKHVRRPWDSHAPGFAAFKSAYEAAASAGGLDDLIKMHGEMHHRMHRFMPDLHPYDPALLEMTGVDFQRFLPWHRAFLVVLEQRLGVPIPTWDFVDKPFPDPLVRWTPAGMTGYAPVDKHIGKYKDAAGRKLVGGTTYPIAVRRSTITALGKTTPASKSSLQSARSAPTFLEHTRRIEGPRSSEVLTSLHAPAHMHTGGFHMGLRVRQRGTLTLFFETGADPLFWMLHAFIDREWWAWRAAHTQGAVDPVLGGKDAVFDFTSVGGPKWDIQDLLDVDALGYTYG